MSRSLIPGKVCVVDDDQIPNCYFCEQQGNIVPGPYDFASRLGPWANGCKMHYLILRAAPGLGTGKAQLWVTESQVDRGNRLLHADLDDPADVDFPSWSIAVDHEGERVRDDGPETLYGGLIGQDPY